MNVSGPALKHAWKTFLTELQGAERESALMVVLHDDMEKPPGQCRFRRTGSAQGHNGLKSVMESFATKVSEKGGERMGIEGKGYQANELCYRIF
jgi:PTH1 family peptidyl-tRNA hydrolase